MERGSALLIRIDAERAAREVLAIPIHPQLAENQLAHVCDAIRAFYQGVASNVK